MANEPAVPAFAAVVDEEADADEEDADAAGLLLLLLLPTFAI